MNGPGSFLFFFYLFFCPGAVEWTIFGRRFVFFLFFFYCGNRMVHVIYRWQSWQFFLNEISRRYRRSLNDNRWITTEISTDRGRLLFLVRFFFQSIPFRWRSRRRGRSIKRSKRGFFFFDHPWLQRSIISGPRIVAKFLQVAIIDDQLSRKHQTHSRIV